MLRNIKKLFILMLIMPFVFANISPVIASDQVLIPATATWEQNLTVDNPTVEIQSSTTSGITFTYHVPWQQLSWMLKILPGKPLPA